MAANPFRFDPVEHGRYTVVDRASGETLGWVRRRTGVTAGYYGAWEYRATGGKIQWADSRQSAAAAMRREIDSRAWRLAAAGPCGSCGFSGAKNRGDDGAVCCPQCGESIQVPALGAER